jgi:hypothetical protein
MKGIAAGSGSTLSLTADGKPRAPLVVRTSTIREGAWRLRIRNAGKWVHDKPIDYRGRLTTEALCQTPIMSDKDKRLLLTFHLDDPKTP